MEEGSPGDPFGPLLRAHADFIDKLTEFEAVLDEMASLREARDVHLDLVDEALRFFREELLPHFRSEEDIVLPPIEAKVGRYGSLVNVVAYEHEEIRREVEKLEQARAALRPATDPWPAIQELRRHGLFAIQFLRDHFRKERTSLFPTGRAELSDEDLARIRAGLAGC